MMPWLLHLQTKEAKWQEGRDGVLKITPNQWVSRTLSYIKNELLPAQWAENRVVPGKKSILHLSLRGSRVYENKRGPQATEFNFSEKFISTRRSHRICGSHSNVITAAMISPPAF
jgi:hypothetical protein